MPKDHFRTRGFIEGGVIKNADNIELDISSLPPFLRTLLVADGTVTKSLEAFFWEKVDVETLDQHEEALVSPVSALNASIGDQILKREVRLHGSESNRIYAYASSYLRTDTLDEEVKVSLLAGKIGIGELLREIGLETYREIIDFGQEQEMVYRTYVIHISGEPTIQITERFPLSIFWDKISPKDG